MVDIHSISFLTMSVSPPSLPGVGELVRAHRGGASHPLPGPGHRPPPGEPGGRAHHAGGGEGHRPVPPGHAVHRRDGRETHQPRPTGNPLLSLPMDTYEYEYRYKNMLPSPDEIFKRKKHTILVDNHGYIWIVTVQ